MLSKKVKARIYKNKVRKLFIGPEGRKEWKEIDAIWDWNPLGAFLKKADAMDEHMGDLMGYLDELFSSSAPMSLLSVSRVGQVPRRDREGLLHHVLERDVGLPTPLVVLEDLDNISPEAAEKIQQLSSLGALQSMKEAGVLKAITSILPDPIPPTETPEKT